VQSRLSIAEKNQLLKIARDSIINYVCKAATLSVEASAENLLAKQGCFVTIKHQGKLRGCVGQFTSDKPLCQLIQEMAIAAATRDPRFYPMENEDLQNFDLEISVLSTLQLITSIEDIEIGAHGLYIEKNFFRGVLLPQVAIEHRWDRDTFLAQTCLKAGLDKDAWKEDAEIFIFTAQVFGD
jgi:uncharacterized protein